MSDPIDSGATRRNVLKTAGAVGLFSLAGSGTVAAKKGDLKNDQDVDAFLNAPATFKDPVIWDGSYVMTDEVDVGAVTSINIPGLDIPAAPVSFAPQAIKVEPGTKVTWTWTQDTEDAEIPHDVVARKKAKGEPVFHSGPPMTSGSFEHTFEEPGEYLYYCTPHGAPFAVESFLGGKVHNEFGMRGVVVVMDLD